VGPAVAKVQVPKVLRRTRGTVIDDERLVADDGDRRRHQRREHSDRRGMLALGSGENDERSPPACSLLDPLECVQSEQVVVKQL